MYELAENCKKCGVVLGLCKCCEVSESTETAGSIANNVLWKALNDAAYALFQIKRMGVSDEVRKFASDKHKEACSILDKQ